MHNADFTRLEICWSTMAWFASHSFVDDLYFSAVVFTARSQVKWYPLGIYRYLATIESILGWLLMALFLVKLGRTMIR